MSDHDDEDDIDFKDSDENYENEYLKIIWNILQKSKIS